MSYSIEALRADVETGAIDTVVVAITDMQGRLQGKRFHARSSSTRWLAHGTEGCNYLLAVDVDMNTVDGYAMSSWAAGYGDLAMRPDLSTLRRMPWQPGTAMVLADVLWFDGARVLASPRQILRRQLDRLAELGLYAPYAGTELEFIALPRLVRDGLDRGLPESDAGQPVQRRLLAARHRAGGAAAAPDPHRDGRRRADPGERQGRVQLRPARDRLPVRRRAGLLRPSRRLQERGQGDRCPGGHGADLHGQAERPRGQLLPHPFLAARRERDAGDGRRTGRATCRRSGSRCSPGCWPPCGAFSLLYAPNINSYKRYQAGSFAPTSMRWGTDNRTCALRVVGHAPAAIRVENRTPGGDVNPYLAVAGDGRRRRARHRQGA